MTVLRTLSKCISRRRDVATEPAVFQRLHAWITVASWRRRPAAELGPGAWACSRPLSCSRAAFALRFPGLLCLLRLLLLLVTGPRGRLSLVLPGRLSLVCCPGRLPLCPLTPLCCRLSRRWLALRAPQQRLPPPVACLTSGRLARARSPFLWLSLFVQRHGSLLPRRVARLQLSSRRSRLRRTPYRTPSIPRSGKACCSVRQLRHPGLPLLHRLHGFPRSRRALHFVRLRLVPSRHRVGSSSLMALSL